MVGIAVGHRRTGLCPTFTQPALQRDGYLLRVPLVGGYLLLHQVECLADVAARSGNGVVELTNRANVQLRGLPQHALADALDACRAVGLGDYSASLVTISPFAGAAEHRVRRTLVRALVDVDALRLSRKFAVHVDVAETSAADVHVRLTSSDECQVTVPALGTSTCGSAQEAAALARRVAERCMQHGPHARPADLVATEGTQRFAESLRARRPWLPAPPVRGAPPLQVGIWRSAAGEHVVVAATRFGRFQADTLAAIGALLRTHQLGGLRVSPWRSLLFTCSTAAQADAVLEAAGAAGLLVNPNDPALGVIACIGVAGCWQTELDTLSEAERFVAGRPASIPPGAPVHVSGCDKFCATRAPVTLTLLGRADSSGFDALGPPRE